MTHDDPPLPRRRGRPPLDTADPTTVQVQVRLPTRQYDRLYARATAQRVTVPELVRRAVRRDP
jgi:hypothetical protein